MITKILSVLGLLRDLFQIGMAWYEQYEKMQERQKKRREYETRKKKQKALDDLQKAKSDEEADEALRRFIDSGRK